MEHYLKTEISYDWLFEATVAAHLSRRYPTYYWRSKGKRQLEVDVVCYHDNRQIGFEVSKGLKSWKAPWHVKESSFLLDKDNLPLLEWKFSSL